MDLEKSGKRNPSFIPNIPPGSGKPFPLSSLFLCPVSLQLSLDPSFLQVNSPSLFIELEMDSGW